MANVDEEVDSSSSSSSSSATTTPVVIAAATSESGAGFRHQDSGPRTVCGVGNVGHHQQQQQHLHHGDKVGGLALVRMLKEELKERECASLPPMVYDGKSDLCTLGSRPGMECVPLRSPADPYHYHHVTDQTKSLQELQNEVGALLEFRDLVIETFPDLKTKMASASAANSTLTGIPSSSLASSRREWEPGIRTRRKLTAKDSHLSHQQQPLALVHPHHSQVTSSSSTVTSSGGVIVTSSEIHPHQHHHHHHHHHQQQQQQQHHSSSLISRSRSNSQSGGSSGGGGGGSGHRKEPKSGDAQQSSSGGSVVIQDSGFSTETSSSKETHSASSSTGGGGQGGPGTVNVSSTTGSSSGVPNQRLGVDAEDELWNLLDVIHRKSNRLREEVDALQQLEREKCRTNVLNNNQNVQQTSASSSSSNSSNNNHHHIHSSSSSSSGGNLAKTFQNQLLATVATADTVAVNKDDVQILRKERDRLFEQLSDYEAEAMAARIRASKMQDEVDVLAAAKRDLESQLQAALSQKLELNGRIHDLHQQFVNKSAPSSPDSIKSRHHLQHLPLSTTSGSALRKHSSTDSTTTTLHLSATTSPSSASSNSQQHLLKPAALTRFSSGTGPGNSSHFAPIVKSVPTTTTTGKTAISTPEDVATSPDGGGSSGTLGKLDGLLSSPARVNKVRMTDSKKIAAILLETNIVELQRHLLTITVQNQVLQQRLEYATRSRIFMSKKLDKSKEDIDDLKFRLEEKNIELEGTKAQLRVLESKQQQLQSGKSSVTSSGFSPEHHANPSSTPAATTPITTSTPVKPSSTVVSTSAGGIVTSHLGSPVHQPYHQAPLRLQQGVSTPSMKAMIPLAMDEMLQNSSSTESAQDQAERYHHQQVTPETPKRKPSKIPLPGTKGYVAPKPPTGRNFVANKSTEKSSPSPSGSLSNKSLNKSTGSLYMRSSTGPSSITSRAPRDASINRPESAQSWSRRDTSLEKSRSSSIPVSSKAGGSPVVTKPSPTTVVSSSPQPKAKRDSLTTRVKNLDSLSRLQTAASASTGNLSKSSSKKDLSSTSFTTGQLGRPDRKSTSGGIRRVSSASIGRTSSTENAGGGANSSSSVASPAADADNGKARRTNTFRLAKPTLMPPLEIPSSAPTGAPPRGGIPRRSHLPIVVPPPPRNKMAAASSALIIMASSPDATARHHDSVAASTSSETCSSTSSDGGSSPSSVTTVTTIESHSSSTQVPPVSRDLIGEYLAAKSRSQGPPAILIPQVAPPAREDAKDLELAYKHPILLMNDEDEQNVFCSVVSSVGNERNREVEVRYVDDNSIELLDAREDYGEGEKESLIVPKPKKMAFHSLKGSPVKNGVDEESKCRLVGKVNPNILKTWEQLSGGDKAEPTARRKNSKNSLITITSSENSSADSKQSCLIFYRNQYNNMAAGEPEEEFHVNRIQHGSVSTASSTVEDKAVPAMVTSTTSTTTTTSSEGCYDFYDSIDDSSTRIDGGAGVVVPEDEDGGDDDDDDEEYGMAAGEGLADFTSLDRKKMMWSIDVEQ